MNLDVFFIGTDGNLYNSYWAAAAGSWGTLPVTTGACASGTTCAGSGQPGGGVAAVARNSNQLDVFYIGKDGGVWTSFWSGGAGSASWTTMEITGGAVATAGAHITATARTSEALDVFFVDAFGTLRKSSWTSGAAWGTVAVDGSAALGQPGGLVCPLSRVSRTTSTSCSPGRVGSSNGAPGLIRTRGRPHPSSTSRAPHSVRARWAPAVSRSWLRTASACRSSI